MKGEQYLTKPRQFALVYEKGSSWVSGLAVLKALPNGSGLTRYGFSVSKRVGSAVTRNRVKRLFREILRTTPVACGWDIVIIARPGAAEADYATLKSDIERLLRRGRLLMPGDRDQACFAETNLGRNRGSD